MSRRLSLLVVLAAIVFGAVMWHASIVRAQMHHGKHMGGSMSGGMGGGMMGMSMKMTPQSSKFRHSLDAAERSAARKGHYSCCIKPQCDWCMTHMGECTCNKGVAMGMGACRECHGGWEAGQGRVPGKTKDDVRGMKVIGI